jgi:hypothetical protein
LAWQVQGYQFFFDMKVLSLKHYDVIIGYEWLERFSPMKVHWGAKWKALPYEGHNVVIQGVLSILHELQKELPIAIHQLLPDFDDVFASKVEFLPPRYYCHTIPLILGAGPMSVRPYRYAPVLKDEIEHQV